MNLNYKKRISYIIFGFVSVFSLFIFLPQVVDAATCTASAGNWSAVGTWSCGRVPLSTDDVVIPNTTGVNVTVDTTAVASTVTFTAGNKSNAINISGSNTLTITGLISIGLPSSNKIKKIDVGSGSLTAGSISLLGTTGTTNTTDINVSTGIVTVSGNITSAGVASRIIFSGAGTLNAGGTFLSGATGTFTAGSSIVNYNASGAQNIGPYNYYSLTASGSNTKTTTAAMTVGGNLNINSGTTFATGVTSTWTLGVTGTTTVSGNLTLANTGSKTFSGNVILNAGSVWNETGVASVTINGNIVNNATTFTANTGSHTFSGSNKTFSGSTATVIPGTAIFAGGAYTNNGTFSASTLSTLVGGATFANNGTTTVSVALSGSGGFTQGSTGLLNFASTTIGITTFSANASGNTVSYTASAPQTIRAVPYYNLTLSGSGTKTMTGVTTIGGNFSLIGTSTATAASGLTIGGNVSIGTGTTFNGGAALTHNVVGNWSNAGTFTPSTCTVNFNGGSQLINNANTWYNLSITGTSARTVTLQSGVKQTVSNNLTLNGASGQLLTLAPSASPTQWQLSAPATQSVTYTSPSYSDASSGTTVTATGGTNVDGGNNINWNFISNPIPTTTGISPTSKTAGDAGFTLTVNGTNFVASSTVNFNGSARTTYFSTSTQLTADILSTDLLTVGTSSITVFSPIPGGGTSNSQIFTVNAINTTTGLITSSSTLTYGTSATFTATVTPTSDGSPSGTVTFKDGSVVIGTSTLNGANPGVATLATSTLSVVGSPHSIIAVYGGDSTHNVSTSSNVSQTFTAKNLTVTGITANNKIYDGNASSTLNLGSATLNGVVSGDSVILGTSSAVGTFDTPNVGLGKTVAISGLYITGTSSSNYSLTQPITTADITNPLPTTTSINPTTKNVGDAQFSMTVNGTNFVNGSTVNFNGSARATTYGSSTQLTATILATDLLVATTTAAITVTNSAPGGGTSNAQTFTVIASAPTVNITASSTAITLGQSSQLTWTSTNSTSCTASGDWSGSKATSSSEFVTPLSTGLKTYTLTCGGPGGTASSSATVNVTNPLPTTTSINPTTKNVGDAQFSMTVNGTNFVNGSTVNFNGSARATTYGSSTQLTATILATDLLVATTTAAITVTNSAPGGGTSNAQTFTVVETMPTPVISSISPSSKNVGDPQFILTVIGTGLVASSTVQVNGSDRTTLYSSSTTITATIPASDLLASTTLVITVTNPAPGGVSNSKNLTVSPGAIVPTQFVITSATNGTIDLASYVTIQAQNSAGVLATTYQQDVTLVTNNSASGGGLVNIINGVGTTTISDNVVENVHLSLSDTQSTGLIATSTADISFGPGATKNLTITGSTTAMTAGTRLAMTVTRQDRLGNLVTAGSESFYLYSNSFGAKKFYNAVSGGSIVTEALIPNNYSSATVWYYDDRTGAPRVTVSDSSPTADGPIGVVDATVDLTVTSDVTSSFTINNPGNLIAGQRLAYEVSRRDQFGNTADSDSVTVYLHHTPSGTSTAFYDASSGGATLTSRIMSAGIATTSFWLYADLAGSLTVTASDNSMGGDGSAGINDASDSFTVNPATASILTLNNPGNMTVGTSLGYTVSRYDSYGNTVSTGDLIVNLSHDATGTSTAFYNLASGGITISSVTIADGTYSKDFWFYSEDAGSYNVTTSDGPSGLTDAIDPVVVSLIPIIPFKIVILDPSSPTANVGSTTPIYIQVQDVSGNLDTAYNGSVTLHSTGNSTPGAVGATVNIIGGVGSTNIVDIKAELVSLTLEDTSPTGLDVTSTKSITFIPGPTTKFVMTGTNSSAAGERTQHTIVRKDQYDNQITSGVDAVYLYDNAPIGTANFYNAATAGTQITSASILNGFASTDVWFAGIRSGSWVIDASDNGSHADAGFGIDDATSTVVISPAATARLALNDPGDMFNGTRLGYIGTRYDAYGNEVTSGTTHYFLSSNAAGASTTFYSVASGGSPMTELNFSEGNSQATFWYYETKNGIWTVYLSDNYGGPDGSAGIIDGEDSVTVSAVPIVATKFIIVSDNTALTGSPLTVVVRAVNNNGDIDTTYQHDVTLNASGGATGGGLVDIINGVGQIIINDSNEETINLTLSDTAHTGLNVSDSQSVVFSKTVVIPSGGYGGGGGGWITPQVSFVGRAFPQANVEIMAIQDGQIPVGGRSNVSSGGNFSSKFNGQLPSSANTFALVVYDKDNRIAQTKIFKLGVNDQLISTIFMAPTISLKQQSVGRGVFMGIEGSAMPGYKIEMMLDGVKAPETTSALSDGSYSLNFNTYRLGLGEHTLRVRQVDTQGKSSDYSIEKNFQVIRVLSTKADLNNDGKIDVTDWGIFMARYNSTYPKIKLGADINSDGRVDVSDLNLFKSSLAR